MTPRLLFATFSIPARASNSNPILQCRGNVHIRAIAPALSRHTRHDGSRSIVQENGYMKGWDGPWRRYASTSATPETKTGYGRAMPPPPAKPAKGNVPTKMTNPSKARPPIRPSTPPMTVPARSPASKTTTVPTAQAKEKLNPPSFTYAPEVAVPARKANQNRFSWLYQAGRAYLTFYKTGISHVRQTSKLAKTLRAKAAKAPGKDITEVLTRAEWQITRRSRKDVLRLPPFGLLVLFLGEWLPLVVLYLTPLIPEPCRIPKQVHRDMTKIEDKRQDRLSRTSRSAMHLQMKDRRPVGAGKNINMDDFKKHPNVVPMGQATREMMAKDMTLFELLLFSATHDCHLRIWDWLHITPPKFLLQRNVSQKLQYLAKDDALIERDGGFAALGKEEVMRACVERGISVLGKREDELRKALATQWTRGKV